MRDRYGHARKIYAYGIRCQLNAHVWVILLVWLKFLFCRLFFGEGIVTVK